MKKSGLLLIISIFLCSIILAACSTTKLDKPVNVEINENAQTIIWDRVENATGYQVEINGGKPVDVSFNSFSFKDLESGDYKFKVRATGKGYKNSDWTELDTYKKLPQLPFMLRLINLNKEYEIYKIGTATGDIVIPDNHPDGRPITSIADAAFYYSSNNRGIITGVTMGNNITKIGNNAFQMQKLTYVNFGKGITTIGKLAFSYCESLESIEIPDTVTSVGENAFIRCKELESVKIGKGISSLSKGIFEICEKLKEIEIPGTVKEIEANAFRNCLSLETVKIKDGVTSIGDEAFSECVELSNLEISDSVTVIGKHAFFDCIKLESANLGSGITKLGAYAFNQTGMWLNAAKTDDLVYAGNYVVGFTDATALTKTIEPGTLGIGDSAFQKWNGMTSLTIPNTVKFIGEYSFYLCVALPSIIIPESVATIGNYAFRNCTLLGNVKINGSGLKRMGAYAFQETKLYDDVAPPLDGTTDDTKTGILIIDGKWAAQTIPDRNRSKAYIGKSTVTLPAALEGIADCAFTGCDNLGELQFGSSGATKLRTIGDFAFNNSERLYTFNQPDFESRYIALLTANPDMGLNEGIDIVGEHHIPNTVEYIGEYAFHSVTGIRRLYLGTGVKTIGTAAFRNSWRMPEVIIPDSVESIGSAAFYNCLQIQYVKIGKGVKEIGDYAFNDIPELRLVEFADGIKNTGNYTFGGCPKLEKVVLPSSIETIGDGAFYKCTKLSNITIPAGVTSIGSAAFYNCASIKKITLPQNITSIADYAFYGCNSLESIEIPEKVTSIGFYSFYKCSNAKTLKLNEGLELIDSYAFYGCGYLTTITIPLSVKSIGSHTFRNCAGVTSVIIRDTIIKMGSHAFYGSNLMTIYCEPASIPESWNSDWNSSYRPVVWNCKLTEDKMGVESFRKVAKSINNPNAPNGIKAPVYAGYTFAGWSFEKGGTTEYAPDKINTAPNNITLYAIWRPIKYTVSFDSDNGSDVSPITGDCGTLINKPGNPTKEGYTFQGWYKNAELTKEWDFDKDKIPAGGITLYAKWEINE